MVNITSQSSKYYILHISQNNKIISFNGEIFFILFYKMDDNQEIMNLLQERLNLGKARYGHGVIVDQNTKDFGTNDNDWQLMALEEMLDGLIYTTASIIRYRREQFKCNEYTAVSKIVNKLNQVSFENKQLKQQLSNITLQ